MSFQQASYTAQAYSMMYPTITLTRSRSDSSSTSSSTSSPSNSPRTLCPFSSTPLKSGPSPPTTTTSLFSTDYFSLSHRSAFSLSSPPIPSLSFSPGSPAYPSWPRRPTLTNLPSLPQSPSSAYPYALVAAPNSHISTEDLLDLENWALASPEIQADEDALAAPCISWSATRQPEVITGEERRRRTFAYGPSVKTVKKDRSRSGSRGLRGPSKKALNTIAE
jgi:hypothetical protein